MGSLSRTAAVASLALLTACGRPAEPVTDYYGTLEPFAAEAVYFVVTDRFVDGDAGNNFPEQGAPDRRTFDRPVTDGHGRSGNIGYLGGDFRGIADNAGYIADMGFTALWLTPIVDNPDEAFTGGVGVGEGLFADRGKAGYHGYWGVNFFAVDEHLPSPGLGFAGLTALLSRDHGIKTVLDVVCNHGSPSFTMPADQPMFGEIYAADGTLLADHGNLHPTELDPGNPLHAFFHPEPDLAQLSNLNDTNPAVLDYFVDAYSRRIGEGAAAFRIDTVKHMPTAYWREFAERIRAGHPGFFMFGEVFSSDRDELAEYTYAANGDMSVLDFPGKDRMLEMFGAAGAGFEVAVDALALTAGIYRNPYELMTFYDNHDMPRMAADDAGFINAHNWLFTARGIPVVYYGSEIGFRAGAPEHGGNRDYFGQDNVERARAHPIHAALKRIAGVRRESIALQRGLQANIEFGGDRAVFYRVYQRDGISQTALVVLNKGAAADRVTVAVGLSPGRWVDAFDGSTVDVTAAEPVLTLVVPANGVRVLLLDAPNVSAALAVRLDELMAHRQGSAGTAQR
ncbi:MAG: alpha-amylase family glycosyl hydrolase [Pseudomonadota bacterium]